MTKSLTLELLREFLGGPMEINNPHCRYLGIPGEVCLDPRDVMGDKIRWIGVRFNWLMEMVNGRPVGRTRKQNIVLEFNPVGKAYLGVKGKRECLVVPTDIRGEEIKILK